jgi:hypothetical protein
MSVEPEVADFLLLLAEMRSHPGRRADGDGMIPAENEREKALR